jgi:hypothetical protein
MLKSLAEKGRSASDFKREHSNKLQHTSSTPPQETDANLVMPSQADLIRNRAKMLASTDDAHVLSQVLSKHGCMLPRDLRFLNLALRYKIPAQELRAMSTLPEPVVNGMQRQVFGSSILLSAERKVKNLKSK